MSRCPARPRRRSAQGGRASRPRRPRRPRAPEPREGAAIRSSGSAKRRRRSRRRRSRSRRAPARGCRDLGEQQLLERVLGAGGSPRRPAVCAAGGEHPGVLARAVVAEPRRRRPSGAALEVVLGRAGAGEQRADRGELLGRAPRCEAHAIASSSPARSGTRARERERLQRLRRRADEGDQTRVAGASRRPRRRERRRHARGGRDSTVSPRRTATLSGSARAGERMPELPEMEAWRRALDEPCRRHRSCRPGRRTSPR